MPHETILIETLVMSLGFAFAFGFLASRIGISPIVGYLVAGIVVGPYTPGLVADTSIAGQLAEIGVILLMFGVGLHFSIPDLLAVWRIALIGAVAQIVIGTVIGAYVAITWGWGFGAAGTLGVALSIASTVVFLRALDERKAIGTIDGRIAVGWLVVEDLATVLVLVLLPALAAARGSTAGAAHGADGGGSLVVELALTLGKVALFIALALLLGKRIVPWLLQLVARTRSRELFTLAVLATAIGIAFGAAELFDVSFALGAFLAGVVLSESDLSHQAAADLLPFQDAFAVLFFVSVGMLFDYSILGREPGAVAAVLAIIIVGKFIAGFAIVRAFRYPLGTALTIATGLTQIGEFSFILAGMGVELGVLPAAGRDLILAGAIFSIMINSLLFRLIGPLERWLHRRPRILALVQRRDARPAPLEQPSQEGHVVIAGFGRVGGPVGAALDKARVPYTIIDENRQLVDRLRAAGHRVVFGDAAAASVLHAAYAEHARLLIVAVPGGFKAALIVLAARALNPEIDTIVRTHSDEETAHLEGLGVGVAVMGERELARAISGHALRRLGLDEEIVIS
jgi:CPA2 family monovalent cation:H+ antiporter-2